MSALLRRSAIPSGTVSIVFRVGTVSIVFRVGTVSIVFRVGTVSIAAKAAFSGARSPRCAPRMSSHGEAAGERGYGEPAVNLPELK
ncbi:hypothetical protein SAMN04487982_116216 [Streptomyces sp. ok210]|nr:hypothetical protein SAMN04487982_116216 [Streptomyces sp. ok210]